jgi:hypothetical protein
MCPRGIKKKYLRVRMNSYLVSDYFCVEFKTFGDVEFAKRGTELTHHFQLGPHVAACATLFVAVKIKILNQVRVFR